MKRTSFHRLNLKAITALAAAFLAVIAVHASVRTPAAPAGTLPGAREDVGGPTPLATTASSPAIAPHLAAALSQGQDGGDKGQRERAPFGAEKITLRRTGFEPRELTLPQGRYLLILSNRSGMPEARFRLADQSGRALREERVTKRQLDRAGVVELRAGRYELTVAGHPEWVCRVTVTAK